MVYPLHIHKKKDEFKTHQLTHIKRSPAKASNTLVNNSSNPLGEVDEAVGKFDEAVGKVDEAVGENDVVVGENDVIVGEVDEAVGEIDEAVGEVDVVVSKHCSMSFLLLAAAFRHGILS